MFPFPCFIPAVGGGGFPTVVAVAETNSEQDTDTVSLNLPASVADGDRLLAVYARSGGGNITDSAGWPTGWTELSSAFNAKGNVTIHVAYKDVSTGDAEIGASTISVTSTQTGSHRFVLAWIWQLTGYTSADAPEWSNDGGGISSANPDPPSLSPSFGSADYLWIAGFFNGAETTTSAYPSNYSDNQSADTALGANAISGAVCSRNLTASSEDPGTFTISSNVSCGSFTVAVNGT